MGAGGGGKGETWKPWECYACPEVPRGLTYVTVVHPDTVAIVASPALHDIVGIVRLGNLVVGVNDDLGDRQVRGAVETRLGHKPLQAQGPAETSPASRAGVTSQKGAWQVLCYKGSWGRTG